MAPVAPGATGGHRGYSGIVVKVAAGTVQQELCENGVVAANLLYVETKAQEAWLSWSQMSRHTESGHV